MADLTPQMQTDQTAIGQQPVSVDLGKRPSIIKDIVGIVKNLSTREKALIWILLITALVLALLLLLILPANDRMIAARSDLEALRSEQLTTQLTIAATPTNQARLDDAQARHDLALLQYQAPMLPEDIDRMLTSLLINCGFSASSLNLNIVRYDTVPSFMPAEPVWEIPNPQVIEDSIEGTVTVETVETDQDADGEGGTTQQTGGGTDAALADAEGLEVQVVDVQVSVVGRAENFYAMLNWVLPQSWIKVTSTTFSPPIWVFTWFWWELEQTYTINFRIYLNSEATAKQL